MKTRIKSLALDIGQEIDVDELVFNATANLDEIESQNRQIGNVPNSYKHYTPAYKPIIEPSWHGDLSLREQSQFEFNNSVYRCGR